MAAGTDLTPPLPHPVLLSLLSIHNDEVVPAREEHLQREDERRCESDPRLAMLRRNCGLIQAESMSPSTPPPAPTSITDPEDVLPSAATSDGDHINLFSGGGRAGRSRARTSRRMSSADRRWVRGAPPPRLRHAQLPTQGSL